MATSTTSIRFRRNAVQLYALSNVERKMRAADSNSNHKYLREFREAYSSYHSVLSRLKFLGVDKRPTNQQVDAACPRLSSEPA
jgi:hypothetical protein